MKRCVVAVAVVASAMAVGSAHAADVVVTSGPQLVHTTASACASTGYQSPVMDVSALEFVTLILIDRVSLGGGAAGELGNTYAQIVTPTTTATAGPNDSLDLTMLPTSPGGIGPVSNGAGTTSITRSYALWGVNRIRFGTVTGPMTGTACSRTLTWWTVGQPRAGGSSAPAIQEVKLSQAGSDNDVNISGGISDSDLTAPLDVDCVSGCDSGGGGGLSADDSTALGDSRKLLGWAIGVGLAGMFSVAFWRTFGRNVA